MIHLKECSGTDFQVSFVISAYPYLTLQHVR